MKQIFFTIVCCLLFLAACTDFLKEKPLSVLSTEQFFTGRENAFASVNVLYRKGVIDHMSARSFTGCIYFFPTVYRAGGLIDNRLGRTGNSDIDMVLCWTINERYPDGGLTRSDLWTDPYEVIVRNANFALEGLPDCQGLSDAARYAQLLIESGKYALIEHGTGFDKSDSSTWNQSAYNTLRISDNEREYLFVREYDAVISDAGYQPAWCLPWEASTWGLTYNVYGEEYLPDMRLLAVYDPVNDLRFQERQYFHTTYTDKFGIKHDFNRPYPFFWWEEKALTLTRVAEKDMNVYRLAEMYLTAAEALVEAGGTVADEAAGYLATIQARASLNRDYQTIKTELLSLSKEAFVNEVLTERIRELMFECKLWNDIARTRKYPSLDEAGKFIFIPLIGADAVVNNPGPYSYAGRYKEDNLYFPIPSLAVERNPKLLEPELE